MSPTEKIGAKTAPSTEYNSGLDPRGPDFDIGRNPATKVYKADSTSSANVLALKGDEAQVLRDLAAQLVSNPSENPDRYCGEASLLAARLPHRVRRQLAEFARNGNHDGVLVVRGLPVEAELAPTPPDNTSHLGETTLAAAAQAIVNQCLGEMVAYETEDGQLFQDVVPTRRAANTQTSLSCGVELQPHTEQAFSPMPPNWVSLGALRGDREAATYTLSARTLLAALEPSERQLLRQPLWTAGGDEPFLGGGHRFRGADLHESFPIIEGSDEDPRIRFDQDLFWGVSKEAEGLRRRVIGLYPALRIAHRLAPGELMIIDNLRVVHGRSAFRARFDGADRFIVRSFVVRDFVRSPQVREGNGRTIRGASA